MPSTLKRSHWRQFISPGEQCIYQLITTGELFDFAYDGPIFLVPLSRHIQVHLYLFYRCVKRGLMQNGVGLVKPGLVKPGLTSQTTGLVIFFRIVEAGVSLKLM